MSMKLLCLLMINIVHSQVHWSNLTRLGVFDYSIRDYKISTPGSNQNLIIKLMPNLQGASSCSQTEVANYKRMVTEILKPIKQVLNIMQNAFQIRQGSERFFGLIVSGIALGVATSAQITAGMAMENTRLNAENIERLKNALKNSNKAIERLQLSQEKTVLAVQGVQDYINKEILPKVSTLECQVVGIEVGLALLRYYSSILTIFGPNLRDPIAAGISIQALSQLAGGSIPALMNELGYSAEDLIDVLESGSIKGHIVDVLVEELVIIINVNYPVITTMEGFQMHEISKISFNSGPEEMMTLIPGYVMTRGYLISNVDIDGCTITKSSLICSKDQTYPMTASMQQCLRGDTSACPISKIVGSSIGRFIIYKGNLFANCKVLICRCADSAQMIAQDSSRLLTYITSEQCKEVIVDGIRVMLGNKVFDPVLYNSSVDIGNISPFAPLDLSAELGVAMHEINKSKDLVQHSNQIISTMTGIDALWRHTHATAAFSSLVIIIIIAIGIYLFCKYYKKQRYGRLVIPDNHQQFPSMYGTSRSYVNTIS